MIFFIGLTSEGKEDEKNIDKKRRGNKNEQGSHRSESMRTPTSNGSQFDLHQIHKSHHQKPASKNRPKSRNQSPQPQNHRVNFRNAVDPAVVVVGGGQHVTIVDVLAEVDHVFESQGDEAWKEEGAEGVHVERDEAFGNGGSGGAVCVVGVDEGVGGAGGGDAEEEG